MSTFDFVLVGGGLQNGLLALALARQPGVRVALVERGERLGGNHTWCFHAGDVPPSALSWMEPLIVRRWAGYAVHFPGLDRELQEPYAAVTSDRLHDVVSDLARQHPGVEIHLGEAVRSIAPGRVELASGGMLEAKLVVDARGPQALTTDAAAYQKFIGLELEVDGQAPSWPTLMDARVAQCDGFRFFYVLPLGPSRLLVEDTYFSNSPRLDREQLRLEIERYVRALGLGVRRVLREEGGVLPLPLRRTPQFEARPGLLRAGYGGGWFHPTTGYSFPLALRLADEIASSPPADLQARLLTLGRERVRQQRFCILLNRMLFDAFAAEDRFHVLERFYRLPAPTVRRFYSLSLTHGDRLRILCGRPPRGFSASRLLGRRTPSEVQVRGEYL